MTEALGTIDNALIQALTYVVAVAGVLVAFRICRYPDLTPDGSFLLGSSCFAALTTMGVPWPFGLAVCALAGAVAGAVTAGLNAIFRISRLLTGILTTMVCYSLSFRVLGGRPNVGISDAQTVFSWARSTDRATNGVLAVHPFETLVTAAVAAALCGFAYLVLRSEVGLFVRANGENPSRIEDLGRRSAIYTAMGLALANGLVACAGAVLTARQGFADISTGFGVIIALVAALVMGEEVVRRAFTKWSEPLARQFAAAMVGSFLYFLIYLVVLRLSVLGVLPFAVRPTDLKLISVLLVIGVIALNRGRLTRGEDVLPL